MKYFYKTVVFRYMLIAILIVGLTYTSFYEWRKNGGNWKFLKRRTGKSMFSVFNYMMPMYYFYKLILVTI